MGVHVIRMGSRLSELVSHRMDPFNGKGVVELCGLPGSGKTTLASLLVCEKGLRKCDHNARNSRGVSLLLGDYLLRSFKDGWFWGGASQVAIIGDGQRARVRRGVALLKETVKRGQLDHGVCVVDQGVIQALVAFAFFCDKLGDDVMGRFLSTVYGRDSKATILMVDVDPIVAYSSLVERSRTGVHNPTMFDEMRKDQVLAAMKHQREIGFRVLSMLKLQGLASVYFIERFEDRFDLMSDGNSLSANGWAV